MSVNGDTMVIRNGRSTSQVSVYNYPEHLNPFYEDDNHKRLRFWRINKSSKDGECRRSSFSLGGLKEMWAFKSFRSKKKSSTLGINKTSESPPPLRREIYGNENGYNTYDPRMRYTTGVTNESLSSNAFQRNVPYRSSLQDMRSAQNSQSNGIGFNRNDRYRSTIQPAATSGIHNQTLPLPTSRRYVYGGSLTPQPLRNLDFNSDTLGMISCGSSQVSVASTNPFDDEDDDDGATSGISATSTPAKRPVRKKRRAPPPPIPVHQIIKEESSSGGSTPSHNLSASQTKTVNDNENECLAIMSLTAEIESFVRTSNTENTEYPECSSSNSLQKQNGAISNPTDSPSYALSNSNSNIVISLDNEPLFIKEDNDKLKIEEIPLKDEEHQQSKEIGHVETIYIRGESSHSTPERIEFGGVSSFQTAINQDSAKNECFTKVSDTETETPEKKKPTIAAKPRIPKSSVAVSSNMSLSLPSLDNLSPKTVNNQVTKEEIKNVVEDSSITEISFREREIEDENSQNCSSSTSQGINLRTQHNVNEVHQNTPPPFELSHNQSDQLLIIEDRIEPTNKTESNVSEQSTPSSTLLESTKQSKEDLKLPEESSLNYEESLPTTVSNLQLIISGIEEVSDRIENNSTEKPEENLSVLKTTTGKTSTFEHDHSTKAPIQKPLRAKHVAEDIDLSIYRPGPSQWKQSTLAPLEPVPPEKRRSVKQIIESINRNQQLLGCVKKDETENDNNSSQLNQAEANINVMDQNLKSLAESQREMKRMLLELEGLENAHEQKLSNKTDENYQGIFNTIVSSLSKETDSKTNGDIFKKCTITKEVSNASRESSPISSNLDWNPLPKPKRTNKNLSPDLEEKTNDSNI